MKKILTLVAVAMVIGNMAFDATENARTAIVERASVLDSI